MTLRSLILATAVAAASLAIAGTAVADCNDGHTVATKEAPVAATQPAPKAAADTAATDTKHAQDASKLRTAEAKPAVR